jgi:hypothetical protein
MALIFLLWFVMAAEVVFVVALNVKKGVSKAGEIVKIPDTLFLKRSLIFVSGLVSCVGVVAMQTTYIPYSWGLPSVDWNALDCGGLLTRNHATQCATRITLFLEMVGPGKW